jgi:CRP-like cAMP-binding protein
LTGITPDHPGNRDGILVGESFTENERGLYQLLEKSSFLKKVPLFKEISENYLVPLAKIAHAVKLNSGETLFHQGDRGDAMYIIRFGSISVQVNNIEVNRMGVGECIGEMALLDDTPRSASCVAEGDTELLRIGANDFETVVRSQSSVVFAILRTLAKRLRQQTAGSTQRLQIRFFEDAPLNSK